ncbi:MAG: hypothetical protein ABR915_24775 [Thermoguttaceae bacterium]|jgi:hypothetical protein
MPILEVSDDGVLRVPGELLAGARPHAQFELDVLGDLVLLRPAGTTGALWRQATPIERAEAFERWAATSPPDTPDLPAESLRREGIYE